MGSRRGHRIFSAFWARAARREGRKQRSARQAVASGARGRVLEIGAGTGTNWSVLPRGVTEVAVEPDPFMLSHARRALRTADAPHALVQARAEALPFRDGTFDTVVATLTFCSVADPAAALSEVRRVLRPGGEFRFWEHVRPQGLAPGLLSDMATPAFRILGAGCHPNRDTLSAIAAAGLHLVEVERRGHPGAPWVQGIARA